MTREEIILHISERINSLAQEELSLDTTERNQRHRYYTCTDQRKVLEELLDEIMKEV